MRLPWKRRPKRQPLRYRCSQSRLTEFLKCPWAFAEAELRGRPGEPSPAMASGTRCHQVIAEYLHLLRDKEARFLPHEFGEIMARREIPVSEAEFLMRWAQEAAGTLAWEQFVLIDPHEEPVDWWRGIPLGEGLPVLRGDPDLVCIDGEVATIYDWKAGFLVPDRGGLQGRTYAALVLNQWPGVHTVRFVYWMVRLGFSKRFTYDRGDTDVTLGYVRGICERIRACWEGDEWSATPNEWCHACSHFSDGSCPRLEEFAHWPQDDPDSLANHIRLNKAAAKHHEQESDRWTLQLKHLLDERNGWKRAAA